MRILLLLHGHNLVKELFCRGTRSYSDSLVHFLKRHGGHYVVIRMRIQDFCRKEVRQGIITDSRERKAIYDVMKTANFDILLAFCTGMH